MSGEGEMLKRELRIWPLNLFLCLLSPLPLSTPISLVWLLQILSLRGDTGSARSYPRLNAILSRGRVKKEGGMRPPSLLSLLALVAERFPELVFGEVIVTSDPGVVRRCVGF